MKPKVRDNERRTMGERGPLSTIAALHTLLTNPRRGHPPPPHSNPTTDVTERCRHGEILRAACGKVAVGCQPSEWILAITKERGETLWEERMGRPNNGGNYQSPCACLTRKPLKEMRRMEKSTVACCKVFSYCQL